MSVGFNFIILTDFWIIHYEKSELTFSSRDWTAEFIEKPFKLYRIRNLFSDSENVINLQKELNQLQFSPKMNDIFSLSQTEDLFIVKKKKTLPLLQKYLKFLEQFRKFLSEKLNIQLDSKISVSSSKYSYRDYLLCHDDKCEDRHVAFIFYLNPFWKVEWGGSLDLFNHDIDGQPSDIAYQIYPEFNSLIFFEVGNYTYHQVAEVLSDGVTRITINGWYHSAKAQLLKPLIYCEPPIEFASTHSKGELMYLHHFASNEFLNEKYTELIVEHIQETGVIMLQNFLKSHIFNRISNELNSASVQWRRKGPANRRLEAHFRRRFDVVDTHNLPPMTTAFINFVKSKYMCSYFESITNYTLQKENDSFENTGAVICEVQFWKSSCYSVLTDKDPNFEVETLDIWLFFNVQEDTCCDELSDVQAGNIYYWEKNDTTVRCEITPKNNSICLVHKPKNETTFVSYISGTSSLKYNAVLIRFKI